MKKDSFGDLWAHELRDLRSAEQDMLGALPEPGASEDDPVRKAFTDHRDRAEEHLERLREIFVAGVRAERSTGRVEPTRRRRARRSSRPQRDTSSAEA